MRTSRTIKFASDETDIEDIGTSFDAAKYSTIQLTPGNFLGKISGVVIHVRDITGNASSLTMRVCEDALGNVCVITDTSSSISLGVSAATTGTADYKADVDFSISPGTVYVFCKTNQGTCDIDSVTITWEQ